MFPATYRATFSARFHATCNSPDWLPNDDIHPAASADDFCPGRHEITTVSDAAPHPFMPRHPSHVLIVVAGSRADVVGAALTSYVSQTHRDVDELHVLTSAQHGTHLRADLLQSAADDPLADAYARLGIERSDVLFGNRTIHALGASADPANPGPAADDVLDALRRLCGDDNEVAIVASPDAGMLGILAHAALQLVGGHKDRFYYLEFDTAPDKGAPARGRPVARRRSLAATAVLLPEMPTVLAPQPIEAVHTFQQLADARRLARQRLASPGTMVLIGRRRLVRIDDIEVTLPRLQFFWLFVLAALAPGSFPLKALTGSFHVDARSRVSIAGTPPDRAALEALVATLQKIFVTLFPGADDDFPRVLKHACGPSPGLPSIIAKINAKLKHALGIGAAPYLVTGGRGAEGYRLTLPTTNITIEPRIALAHHTRH
jgi:hypothetical protein